MSQRKLTSSRNRSNNLDKAKPCSARESTLSDVIVAQQRPSKFATADHSPTTVDIVMSELPGLSEAELAALRLLLGGRLADILQGS